MRTRFVIGVLVAASLAVSVRVAFAGGEYNSNPAWCNTHSFIDDPFWWVYWECWLPDPPNNPY